MKKPSKKTAVFAVFSLAFAIAYGNGKVVTGTASISSFMHLATNLVSMMVEATAPDISTVKTTTNLVDGTWENAAHSISIGGPFATGPLTSTNGAVYVQTADGSSRFFTIGDN